MLSVTSLMVLATWLATAASLAGLGALVLRLGGSPARSVDDLFLSFWIGWVCLLFLLEVWHLALPVGGRAFLLVATIGAAGLASTGGEVWRTLLRGWFGHLPALVLLGLFAACASNLALGGARHGDTAGYFVPTMLWLRAHAIVPGLGNLMVPLGFNQSHFLYAAFLDVGPIAGHSHQVANGLLILVLGARGLLGASRLARWRRACSPPDVFHAIVLPVATSQAFGFFMTSPSPDLPVLVLGLVVTGELLAFLSAPPESASVRDLLALTLLAVGGVRVKQSFGGLGAATLAVAESVWLWRRRVRWPRSALVAVGIAALGVVSFAPWVARSIVLTGYPFYPSSFGALPVEWRMQVDWNSWMVNIMTFSASEAFTSPRTFLRRLDSFGWGAPDVIAPLGIALGAAFLGLVAMCARRLRGKRPSPRRVSVLVLLPAAMSFGFCLVKAPMARYFGSVYWLFAGESALLALGGAVYEPGHRLRRVVLAAACVAAACVPVWQGRSLLVRRSGFELEALVAVKEVRLATGLTVHVPVSGCSCGTAPLPCTATPNQALRLRRRGDIDAGFLIDPLVAWARHPDGDPSCQMGEPRGESGVPAGP